MMRHPALIAAAAAGALALALTGCSAVDPVAPAAVPSTPLATAPAPAVRAISKTDAAAGVPANFELFTTTLSRTLAVDHARSVAALTSAIASVGFDRATVQASAERTSVGLDVSAVQFTTRWAGHCFIAQYTLAGSLETTSVVDPLADGSCLIGPGLDAR